MRSIRKVCVVSPITGEIEPVVLNKIGVKGIVSIIFSENVLDGYHGRSKVIVLTDSINGNMLMMKPRVFQIFIYLTCRQALRCIEGVIIPSRTIKCVVTKSGYITGFSFHAVDIRDI